MDRRSFLKISAGAVASGFVPDIRLFTPSKPIKPRDFDPDSEHGNFIDFSGKGDGQCFRDPVFWDSVKKIMYDDMLEVVPEKYRYRVQFRCRIPKDYGRNQGLAWYYPPKNMLPLPVFSERNGYSII